LKQISVVGDTNGIFSVGDESGELAVDVGKKWPNADQLDGVEGSSYARTDVNETFNNDLYVNGGNVGIGTNSPAQKLDVQGGHINLQDGYSLGWGGSRSTQIDTNIFIDNLRFIVTGTEAMNIRGSGNVGIGTTSPDDKLEINGGGIRIQESSWASINFESGSTKVLRLTGKSGDNGGGFYSMDGSTARLFVDKDNGSVGIGTTAPSYALDTASDIRAQGIFRGTELRDDSGYVEGLFGEGFVLKDQRNSNGRSYMELDDMRVRGELRAHIFKKDIVRATNALLYVSDAAQTTEDVTTPSSTGSTFTLYVDTNVFQAGEEITFKDSSGGGITEVVGTVSNVVGSTTRGGQTVFELSVTLDFGTSATIPGGSTVVRTSGARMLLDASTADAPVQKLFDQNGNRRMAEGNLDGQFGITSETYGMAAGTEGGAHIKATENGIRIYDSTNTAFFKVDPSLSPEVQLDGDALVNGTVTSDKITVNDVLTLQPGGAFFAGASQTAFAFGDFSLDRKVKTPNPETFNFGAFADSGSGGTASDQDSEVRTDIDMGGSDPNSDAWAASATTDYNIRSDPASDASATAKLEIVAEDGNGTALCSAVEVAKVDAGSSDSGTITTRLLLPDGTKQVRVRCVAEADEGADIDPTSSTADIGDDIDGVVQTSVKVSITASTDFFGPDGATWRSGGNVQVEINGRGNTSSQTTGAGQIWVRDKVIENSDLRNKDAVQGIEGGLDVMRDLRGITYDRGAGIAAQDLIGTFEDALHGSEEEGYSVAYNALWAPAIGAIQSLDDRLSQVEDQINA